MSTRRAFLWTLFGLSLLGCGESRLAGGVSETGNAVTARILVVDSIGNPVPNTDLVVRPSDWVPGDPLDSSGAIPVAVRTRTDRAGWSEIVVRSGEYAIRAGHGNIGGMTRVSVKDGAEIVLGIYPTGAVRGSIRGDFTGVSVAVRGLESVAEMDSAGRFVLSCVPVGSMDIVARSSGASVDLERVAILDRKISDVGIVTFEGKGDVKLSPVVRVSSEPLPPVFLQKQGIYAGFQRIEIVPPIEGDRLEVSIDGALWVSSNGIVRLGGDACIAARSVQSGSTRSAAAEACYAIQPE